MHQVKVYDGSGNLKKVISVKALNKRSDNLIESPSQYRRNRGNAKPPAAPIESTSDKAK
tara:strand:- start:2242 stop:2418 length:177 start_codon:yes stop_codon:yes gene_type:complete